MAVMIDRKKKNSLVLAFLVLVYMYKDLLLLLPLLLLPPVTRSCRLSPTTSHDHFIVAYTLYFVVLAGVTAYVGRTYLQEGERS